MTCAIYTLAGLFSNSTGNTTDLEQLFNREIILHWSVLIPAVIILALSIFQVNVKIAMSVSILASVFLCLLIQGMEMMAILKLIFKGYSAVDHELSVMLNGGGIFSMLKVMAIVCISSSYAGIFQQTSLLNGIKELLVKVSEKITPFGGTLLTSIVAAMLACNQTLTIMLTHQLCSEIEPDAKELAINLENSAVVIPPLIPWSIAGAVPLASAGAPTASLLAACFLYLLPIYVFLLNLYRNKIKNLATDSL